MLTVGHLEKGFAWVSRQDHIFVAMLCKLHKTTRHILSLLLYLYINIYTVVVMGIGILLIDTANYMNTDNLFRSTTK
jgi:hypothetical protein